MHFSEDFIRSLKDKTDIIGLLKSNGIQVKQEGKTHKAFCPFHRDGKTPNLSVDPEKGLYHCFSCGASGDSISFLQNHKHMSFQDAVNLLSATVGVSPVSAPPVGGAPGAVVSGSGGGSKPGITAKRRRELLDRYVEICRGNLGQSESALSYLKNERGITDNEVIRRFRIGFANGNLEKMVADASEQQQELIDLGLLNEKGKEKFKGMLVFPILADESVVFLYGRAIVSNAKFKHQYLQGEERGVFNGKAFKVYDEIILCECIIDALTLINHGLWNVSCTYGLNGFTDDLRQALSNTKKLYFAFDSGEKEEKQALKYAQQFPNITSKRVQLPEPYRDVNEYFVSGGFQAENFKELILKSKILHTSDGLPFDVEELDENQTVTYVFTMDEYIIRLSGVPRKYTAPLKVTVKVHYRPTDEKHYDNIDLYNYRSRNMFVGQLCSRFSIDRGSIEKHLITIVEYLEKRNGERVEEPAKDTGPEEHQLSEEEKKEGLRFLRSKDLHKQIIKDMSVMGYVGEDRNKALIYYISKSCKMDKPLSAAIVSRSSAGKSRLLETVEKLMAPEDLISITSSSDQALYYFKEDGLKNKMVTTSEHYGMENIEYLLRELISKGEISKTVSMKNEEGEIETVVMTATGPISYMVTSTEAELNEENLNRYILLHVDESKKQTERILKYQRRQRTLEGYKQKLRQQAVRSRHLSAHRLLTPCVIFNPFTPLLDFPMGRLTARRDQEKFLNVIEAVCFVHQYQREEQSMFVDGREVKYIECTLDDYRVAYKIYVENVLINSLLDMPKMARDLHEEIIRIRREIANEEGKKPSDVLFTRAQIRERTNFTFVQVRNYMRILEEYEFDRTNRPGEGPFQQEIPADVGRNPAASTLNRSRHRSVYRKKG